MLILAVACLLGIAALVLITEYLSKRKILKGEYRRKFLHVTAGSFIAFWPWIISWGYIEIIGLIMLAAVISDHYKGLWNYGKRIGRSTYGEMFLALAILIVALSAHDKIFFALAVLLVALADGLAAVTGIAYGKNWDYKVFGNKKTVIGSMVFWLVAACILGGGLLFAHDMFSFQEYYFMLLLLPPLFTLVENVSVYGLDNLAIPILTVIILRALQI